MAVEPRRGCGYRKVGGLYLVSGSESRECGRLPVPLTVCPVCSAGIKQTRGWTWVDAAHILGAGPCDLDYETVSSCDTCPLSGSVIASIGRAGLLWIGEKFYPTTAEFTTEAAKLGISRRISAIPRGFKVRETWVLFGHPKGADCADCDGRGEDLTEPTDGVPKCRTCKGTGRVPGVFRLFRPTAIEKIITESMASALSSAEVRQLSEQGISIVIVPDDDPDHQGSVHRVRSR